MNDYSTLERSASDPVAAYIMGGHGSVCTSVCTPLHAGELQAAIDRLTRALLTASDDALSGLVAERRALREELRAMPETAAGVTRLEDERARRKREREAHKRAPRRFQPTRREEVTRASRASHEAA